MPLYNPSSGTGSGGGTRIVKTPEAYGAKRDGEETYDAAITSGQAVLTAASGPFTAADVGKAITVNGAGISSRVLSTTILSYQSATQVTLAANAGTTASGKLAVWGTDDSAAVTSAVSAAVAACIADKSYYCEVQFSSGIYVLATKTTGGATLGNALVPLPVVQPTSGQKVTLVLRGAADGGAWNHWDQTQAQKSGAVLRSMLVEQTADGTYGLPSVIGGPTVDVNASPTEKFSNLRPVIDGITVVCPRNPTMLGVDLRRCAQARVGSLACLADDISTGLNGSATNTNGVGLYMPQQGNNDDVHVDEYTCMGFYYGIGFSDHLVANRIGLVYCNTGMFINAGGINLPGHGSSIQYVSCEGSATVLEKNTNGTGQYPIFIGMVNCEVMSSTRFKDASNHLRGEINFSESGVGGTFPDPTVTGCSHVKINNVYRTRGNLTAPSVPSSGAASTAIFRDAAVTVTGGTVTAIAVDGTTTGLTSGTFIVPTGKTITLTYSVAPTWAWTLL